MNVWRQPAEMVKEYASQKGIRYRLLLDGSATAAKYGIDGIPANFFIDPEGNIAASEIGFKGEETLEGPIQKVLPAKGG